MRIVIAPPAAQTKEHRWPTTLTPVGAVVSAEWLTLKDGMISSVYLLLDKARWPEVLERLGVSAASA